MKPLVKTGLIVLAIGVVGITIGPYFLRSIFGLLNLVGIVIIIVGALSSVKPSVHANKGGSKFADGAEYHFEGSGTGLALALKSKTIKLKSGNLTKEYSFSDVRKWERIISSGNHVNIGGLIGHVKNKNINREGSGLFIEVRDIDNPKWRIEMLDKNEQLRWMEILQQSINEG